MAYSPLPVCLLDAIEIVVLRVDAGKQRPDRRQLVAADPTIDDRLRTCLGVESPAPVVLDQRDRHRPVVRADIQFGALGALLVDRVLLIIESNEALMEFPVGIPVTGVEDAVGLRPKYGAQVGFLVVAQSCHERAHRFLGGYEAALRLRRVRGCRLCDSEPEDRSQDRAQASSSAFASMTS